jgi:biopolymer transport protein ExbD
MKIVRRNHIANTVELNITAFLNLMVILVPFLLITAVFSRMTVLDLNLPNLNAKSNQEGPIKLQLELVVHDTSIVIRDANLGAIKVFNREQGEINWQAFTDTMVQIKSRFPKVQNISLLLGREVDYKTLINLMDHVRNADIVQLNGIETVELFPNISIGDAPEDDNNKPVPVDTNGAAK